MMKKVKMNLLKFVLICLMPFSISDVYSQIVANDIGSSQIEYVDNTGGRILIGDLEYNLKLNTKVSDSKKRQLNRYALKVGQRVRFESYFENKAYYITSIVILSK